MAYPRPTLTDLRQLAYNYFVTRLKGSTGVLRRAVIAVASWVMAALVNGLYGYLDYLIRQVFTTTAEMDYLIVQGAEYGLTPTGATSSAGGAICTGLDGKEIPDQTILFQDQFQNTYQTQASGTIADGTVTAPIKATVAGTAGNLPVGAVLTLIYAIAGVDAQATVADDGEGYGLTGGLDAETPESFRGRILARKSAPPNGGTPGDYIGWARAVAGVTRAWVYPANRGGGTVDLTFVIDGRDDIIPLTPDIDAVQAAVDAKRPVTDDCEVFAPIASPVAFTIHGSFTDEVEATIAAALQDMFAADAVPGGAFDLVTGGTFAGGLSFQDQIVPAVAAGAGDTPFNISAPSADVAGVSGHLLTLGVITFTA